MKVVLFLFVIIFSSSLFAQSQSEQEQFNKQIEEIMKAREEMFKSLMDDSMSGDLEKHMLEMMKRFGAADDDFSFGQFDSPVIGEYDWLETNTHRILKMKVKQIKDHPLDIKIEKGMINFKGDVEATQGEGKNLVKKKVHFERAFSLPKDIDQNSPEFENKGEEFLVKFKKLKASKPAKTIENKKKVDERLPVTPESSDLSI